MSNGYCGNKNTQLDDYSAGYKDGYNEARKKFEAPSGKWFHFEGTLTCSECKTEFYDDIMEYCGDDVPKFCPSCGAKMSWTKD